MGLTPTNQHELRLWVDVLDVFFDHLELKTEPAKLRRYLDAIKKISIKAGNKHD